MKKVEEHRRRGESIVLTNGLFRSIACGHVTNLAECGRHGDVLIVAINSDSSVRRLKGPATSCDRRSNRAAMLAALDCVDYVIVFDHDTRMNYCINSDPMCSLKAALTPRKKSWDTRWWKPMVVKFASQA